MRAPAAEVAGEHLSLSKARRCCAPVEMPAWRHGRTRLFTEGLTKCGVPKQSYLCCQLFSYARSNHPTLHRAIAMYTRALEMDLPLMVATPPYDRLVPLMPESTAGRLARGSLLILEAGSENDWSGLADVVTTARARYPAAPVILQVADMGPRMLRLAPQAARMGIRAIVCRDESLAEVLRPVLTCPDNLANDVIEWLEARGRRLAPNTSLIVRQIIELAPRHLHLCELLDTLHQSERTVRHRFRRGRVPEPRAWHQLARALNAALRVQSSPDARVLEVAMDLGYTDHSGMTRQLTRAFGVTPAGIRGTLGWEWLADRWLRKVSTRSRVTS
jgi:AraC-like DNA-binding protein